VVTASGESLRVDQLIQASAKTNSRYFTIRGTFVEQTWNDRETIIVLVWNTGGTAVEHVVKQLWNLRGTVMNDWGNVSVYQMIVKRIQV